MHRHSEWSGYWSDRLIVQTQIEEIEHIIRQLVPIVRQGVRRRRVIADQGVHEETSGHPS